MSRDNSVSIVLATGWTTGVRIPTGIFPSVILCPGLLSDPLCGKAAVAWGSPSSYTTITLMCGALPLVFVAWRRIARVSFALIRLQSRAEIFSKCLSIEIVGLWHLKCYLLCACGDNTGMQFMYPPWRLAAANRYLLLGLGIKYEFR